MSLLAADYDFELPEELIAKHPPERREDARMLVLNRAARTIEHRSFRDFPGYLRIGDLVVLNDTKVIPARLFSDDGRVELLLIRQRESCVWEAMVKPGKRMRVGAQTTVGGIALEVLEILEAGLRVIRFHESPDLDRIGQIPLPPYMGRQAEASDRERYQTVYASQPGAVAAPTAGLHFTPDLLARIEHVFVTLHVGAGTFRPVSVERISDHEMHHEEYSVSPETAAALAQAGRRVAIGTTTVRVIESLLRDAGGFVPWNGSTDIFIHPPYRFGGVDVLLTNFHLPRSTLLMLVSAFAGREFVLEAYEQAVRERYRFYSYGDCMLIV